jgi:hypothetical protein
MARKPTDRPRRPAAAGPPPPPPAAAADSGIRPWHLLLIATVLAVGAGVIASRGSSTVNVVAVAVAIATVAWLAAAAARTVAPLVAPELGEQTEMLGGRTRAALEREKMLVLRSIKEVEFDRAMGKISDADFNEMAARLRARAAGLLRQLDADSSGYRALIERELATRVGRAPAFDSPAPPAAGAADITEPGEAACASCGAANDRDARFCKACGARIEAAR